MTVVFDHGPNGVYERTGECCRCGECCRTGDPFQGELGTPEISGACALLTLLPDGLHACKDRKNPYYLNGCNVFPTHPGQISDKPNCSYTFVRVE
jgi:hypothetical protein